MTPRYRRIFFFFCLLLFLAAATLVVFISGEYALDTDAWKLVRKGLLVVHADPRPDTIILDGTPYHPQSDEWRVAVSPGSYKMRLEKAGYWDWEEPVIVREGLATRIGDVSLFPKNEPSAVQKNVAGFLPHPSNDTLLVWRTTKPILSLLSATGETIQTFNDIATPLNATWAKGKETFTIMTESSLLVGNTDSPVLTHIPGTWEHPDALFAPGTEKTLLVIDHDMLFRVDVITGQRTTLTNISGHLLASPNQYITVLDPTTKTLHVINGQKPQESVLDLPNVTFAAWSPKERLVYGNASELWIADKDFSATLLERTGEELQDAEWLVGRDTLLLRYADSVRILDAPTSQLRETYVVHPKRTVQTLTSEKVLFFLEPNTTLLSFSLVPP